MSAKYRVFHRTWWTRNSAYPGGREPSPGRKHFISWAYTEEEAIEKCEEWNAKHDPGFLSDKAEFEEA